MSAPSDMAPKYEHTSEMLPVPTKGSYDTQPGRIFPWFAMKRESSGFIEVVPRYARLLSENLSMVFRAPDETFLHRYTCLWARSFTMRKLCCGWWSFTLATSQK